MLGYCVDTLELFRPEAEQDGSMHANGHSIPALIIYTVDHNGSSKVNGKKPLVYEREENPGNSVDHSTGEFDVHLGLDATTDYR